MNRTPLLFLCLLFSFCSFAQSPKGQILTTPSLQTGLTKAFNMTGQNEAGVWLSNPHFKALFSPKGLSISPKRNELTWQWSLRCVNGKTPELVMPQLKETVAQAYVDYDRGNIIERYLFNSSHMEQVFVIYQRPPGDLKLKDRSKPRDNLKKPLKIANGPMKKEPSHWGNYMFMMPKGNQSPLSLKSVQIIPQS